MSNSTSNASDGRDPSAGKEDSIKLHRCQAKPGEMKRTANRDKNEANGVNGEKERMRRTKATYGWEQV
ncbi:hypothetical protein EAI_14034 [Harpegnathos saltator]|uniref:Uncharacterized protein n=1 Tax=Harpegnathos saltator TaxID=610380 RepID=E2BYQ6_HARSA|nr:hypothetical protein EAI_14034 [Harpegnathos saltator]